MPNDEGVAILYTMLTEGFWLRNVSADSTLGSYTEKQHSTEMTEQVQRSWGRSMLSMSQEHTEVSETGGEQAGSWAARRELP